MFFWTGQPFPATALVRNVCIFSLSFFSHSGLRQPDVHLKTSAACQWLIMAEWGMYILWIGANFGIYIYISRLCIFWLVTSLHELVPTKAAFRNHSPDKPLIIVGNTEGSLNTFQSLASLRVVTPLIAWLVPLPHGNLQWYACLREFEIYNVIWTERSPTDLRNNFQWQLKASSVHTQISLSLLLPSFILIT